MLAAARVGPNVQGMSGAARALLYHLAVETGLRANELRSLDLGSFRLDDIQPTLMVRAAYSKRRREDRLPLRPEMVKSLRNYLRDFEPGVPIFSMPSRESVTRMLRRDLDEARLTWLEEADALEERSRRVHSSFLKYKDAEGGVADFHAFRHTFITNLVAGGVHPKVAQTLARHGTIGLTMDKYCHVVSGAQSDALAVLPNLDSASAGPDRRHDRSGKGIAG